VAAVVLEATACIQYFYSRAGIRAEAEQRAKTELRRAELEIEVVTSRLEAAALVLAGMAERDLSTPQAMYDASRELLNTLDFVESAGLAFMPDYYPQYGRWFEVCSSRDSLGGIYTRQIGGPGHDYLQAEWFHSGLTVDSCWWSEPYLDNAGAKAMVVSCSYPVHDSTGRVVAVACVDLSLDNLRHLSEYLQIYKGSYYSISSANGLDIVAKPDTVAGRKYTVFDEEIDATGWRITIIIPDDVIYAGLRRVGLVVLLMMLLGLAVLVFIIYRSAKDLVRVITLGNLQDRMESELNIARNIQMAMLPTHFPPFPDYPDLNAYGVVMPAREVGGDLFDFYIRDNRLFFCIGDVSGKGIPASLVMAVTRSLFRSLSAYIDTPSQIMLQMNGSMATEANDQNMFVTLFLGILDLSSGKLLYCNAGHDAPLVLRNGKSGAEALPVLPNLPLGVLSGFAYAEQSAVLEAGDALFLYTDGLTEAENSSHELFGMERIMQTVGRWEPGMSAVRQIESVQAAVEEFVGEAEQSDDLTLFAVRFLSRRAEAGRLPADKEHHSLVMRNDIQQIPTLAQWIASLGLPQSLDMPVNLALEEVVSNVMLYAYPGNGSGQVLVEAEKDAEQVVFTISDSGIPFDPTQQAEPDITLAAEDRPVGGLGIFLVRQIMDDIRYERKDSRNILTLTKKL
jgi:sigma-B regulation protein RsbU (phosphoserine phosphatase)